MTTIKQAKYRVKNEQGTYDVVHFETDITMVNGLDEKVLEVEASIADRYTKTEVDGMFQGTNAEIDAIEEIAGGLTSKVDVINGTLATVEGSITDLQVEDTRLAGEIQSIKDVLTNAGSDNKVFATMEEFKLASLEPKIGDLVYVIDVKKAFIYKGLDALVLDEIPAGWVLFDEITSELDLVNYAKKEDLQTVQSEVAGQGERLTTVEESVGTHAGRIEALETASVDIYTKAQVDQLVDEAIEAQMPVCSSHEPVGNHKAGHIWMELK